MPPLVGLALKVTEAPEQMVVDEADILALTTAGEFTVRTTELLLTVPQVPVMTTEKLPASVVAGF